MLCRLEELVKVMYPDPESARYDKVAIVEDAVTTVRVLLAETTHLREKNNSLEVSPALTIQSILKYSHAGLSLTSACS